MFQELPNAELTLFAAASAEPHLQNGSDLIVVFHPEHEFLEADNLRLVRVHFKSFDRVNDLNDVP